MHKRTLKAVCPSKWSTFWPMDKSKRHMQGPQITEALSHHFQIPHHIDKDFWGREQKLEVQSHSGSHEQRKYSNLKLWFPGPGFFFFFPFTFLLKVAFLYDLVQRLTDAVFWSSPSCAHSALPHGRHLTVPETHPAAFALPIILPGIYCPSQLLEPLAHFT